MERQTKEFQEKIDQMKDEITQLDLDIEENQGNGHLTRQRLLGRMPNELCTKIR